MDFLDNAIDKTKEVFDVVCKKTNEVVSVEKLKYAASSLKSKREKDYIALGKFYFDAQEGADEIPDEVKEIFEDIVDKTAKIAELNKQINEIKNKIICPACETENAQDAQFCKNCGKKLEG